MTACSTTNTYINFTYFKDGLLASQEEWGTGSYGDGTHHTLSYTYDDDGNRASVGLPNTIVAGYTYTGRNQVLDVTAGVGGSKWAEYSYDASGNMKTRTLYNGVATPPAAWFTMRLIECKASTTRLMDQPGGAIMAMM